MTFTEAAAEVLRLAGKPLHYKEITELAIEKNLLSHVGKSPDVTMGARLAALVKKEDKADPIVRVKPGVFALREWDEKKGRKKAEKVEEPADDSTAVNALEVEAAAHPAPPPPTRPEESSPHEAREPREARATHEVESDDGEEVVLSEADALRADLAASGADFFDDEEDDDEPILAPAQTGAAAGAVAQGEGRRRRRRRRRGRGGNGPETGPTAGPVIIERSSSQTRLDAPTIMPGATMEGEPVGTDQQRERDPFAPAPRPMVRDRHQIMVGGSPTGIDVPLAEGDELSGKDLADAAIVVLSAFDRNAGPVPLRAAVDALMRRGRLAGDPALASLQLSASLRADNLRREAQSQRPRFRFSNGSRVALTDWILGTELSRLEQDAIAALERYREGSRRVFLRKVQELPGHAFIELALLAFERLGVAQIRSVRRPGAPNGEAHFAGIHRTGTDEIRTAIVVRKDGREIGRERVTDLRGALHHYGSATAGWLVTTGQVLSGAREEAVAPGAAPVSLFDGFSFCKLLEDFEIGVLKTRFPVAIPDLELFDTLRG